MQEKKLRREHVDGGLIEEIRSRNHNWDLLQEYMGKTKDYNELENKPTINSTELVGDLGLEDMRIEPIDNQDIKKLL